MPLYDVTCPKCESVREVFRSFKNYDDLPECCGVAMKRVVTAAYIAGDIQPYRSMVTGKMVNSRSEHRAILQSHKLVEVGDQTHYLKPKPMTPPPGLKETLVRVANEKLRS